MTEADLARAKIDQAHELLDGVHASAGRVERIRSLLDGIEGDVGRLERKAYLIIPTPRTVWRRLRLA